MVFIRRYKIVLYRGKTKSIKKLVDVLKMYFLRPRTDHFPQPAWCRPSAY